MKSPFLLPHGNLIRMPPGAPTIILLIIFITKKHKRGDLGIPFTQTSIMLKMPVGHRFTRTENVTVESGDIS
jgi:hypothetical protein